MNNYLEQLYITLSIKFLKMSLREQLLTLVCGLVVLILMMHTLLLEPILRDSEKLQRNSARAEIEKSALAVQVESLTNQLKINPNASVLERIELLNQQIQSITAQLDEHTKNLVPANQMTEMLESVLAGSKGLKLIESQSIVPIPIILEQPKEGEKLEASLYRHGVTLEFEGSYFDIQQYLEKLESLEWQFYWKKFDYLVGDYPTASVRLEIYTLSTNKAFVGV